jgi:hypothetical protein
MQLAANHSNHCLCMPAATFKQSVGTTCRRPEYLQTASHSNLDHKSSPRAPERHMHTFQGPTYECFMQERVTRGEARLPLQRSSRNVEASGASFKSSGASFKQFSPPQCLISVAPYHSLFFTLLGRVLISCRRQCQRPTSDIGWQTHSNNGWQHKQQEKKPH